MKKTLIAAGLGAALTVLAGCSTTSTVNEYRGSQISGPEPTGEARVTASVLRIQPESLNTIFLSVEEEVAQTYETEYRSMRDTRYRTQSPDGELIFFSLLIGGGIAAAGYALNEDCDPDDSFCTEDEFDYLISIGAVVAAVGTFVGLLETKSTWRTETEQIGTIVEEETRTQRELYAYGGETISVFRGNGGSHPDLIKETTTNATGRFGLSEQNLLDAGYHPVNLLHATRLEFLLETERHREAFSVHVPSSSFPRSLRVVNEAAIDQLLDADFRSLVGDQSVRISVSYNDASETFWFDVSRLPEDFFATHYERNENALQEAFGNILRNCRTISRDMETDELMYREVYRCLGRMSEDDVDAL